MVIISVLHSRYIIHNNFEKYTISENNDFIQSETNNRLFHLFEMPDKSDLYVVLLENTTNILKVIININIDILKKMVQNGVYIPSRNLLFSLLRKNKNNQHPIGEIINYINKPTKYNKECIPSNNQIIDSPIINDYMKIKLYNYQTENNNWMLDLENNINEFDYIDNNIIKVDDFYIDIEKERFLFKYEYNKIKFTGGSLIDSPGLGKCHLPDTLIYINNKLMKSVDIWKNNSVNIIKYDNEEYSSCKNLIINSYNEKQLNKIELRPIKTLYRQYINEQIKVLTLSNGHTIHITHKHQLLTELGWTNNFKVHEKIAISNKFNQSEYKIYDTDFIKMIVLNELNLIKVLKNKFYIICKQPKFVDIFSEIMLKQYNLNPIITKTKKFTKLEYINNNNIINNIQKYTISTLLKSSIKNQIDFIQFILECTNNKYYSKFYKNLLELDILARRINKRIQIKKCNRKYDFYIGTFKETNISDEILYIPIQKIEYINYKGFVYDFEVDHTHNYIANNIICHNTICMISLAQLNPPKLQLTSSNLIETNYIKNNSHLKSNATLIIAPNHLCEQWKTEIVDKSTRNNKIVLITTKREFCNTVYEDIILADFVIVSFQFLNNQEFKNRWKQYHSCYHQSIMDDTLQTMKDEYLRNKNILQLTSPILPFFHFHRLVIDECHELNKLKNNEYYYQLINLIKSDYRWCISGTPFQNGNIDFYNILNILTHNINSEYLLNNSIVNFIKTKLFRKNTNESVSDEFTLSNIQRSVYILEFTLIEKIMYESFLSIHPKSNQNIYLKHLCCHPNMANKTKESLINCKTLDEINIGMIEYNKKILNETTENLNKINKQLENDTISIQKKNQYENKKNECINTITQINNSIRYYSEIIPKLQNTSINQCSICLESISENEIAITPCGHLYCYKCIYTSYSIKKECPICRNDIKIDEIVKVSYNNINLFDEIVNKYGTKIANLIKYLNNLLSTTDERCIIFSQFDLLLEKIGKILTEYNINNIFCKGNIMRRNKSLSSFKYDENFRVIMLSTKNTASGINLTCSSTIIFLEPIYGTKDYIISTEKQAISRVYRIGQKKQINVVNFIIKNSIEEDIYNKYIKKKDHTINPN